LAYLCRPVVSGYLGPPAGGATWKRPARERADHRRANKRPTRTQSETKQAAAAAATARGRVGLRQ